MKLNPGTKITLTFGQLRKLIKDIVVSEKIDVKQKYPMIPTRDFIIISANPGSTSFTVQAGYNHRRIYCGNTNGDKIVSSYFDGMHAVIVCQKKIFVYGPYKPEEPEKNWRLLQSHLAH